MVLWVLGSVMLAAVIVPWVYRGGKLLADAVEGQAVPAWLEWFGAACGAAKFSRFFNRSLLFCVLALLPVLLRRLKSLGAAERVPAMDCGARLTWRSAAAQVVTGCVIAGGMLWVMGGVLVAAGAYVPKTAGPAPGLILTKILLPAVVTSLVEEWLFRGLLLGLWLRFARPLTACVGTSLLFAFLHFLKPPDVLLIVEPTHPLAGIQLLGNILMQFTDPRFFMLDFASLLIVGLILAWARMRTGALWFSIGLHAGWILVFKGFNLFYYHVPNHPLRSWAVGDSLRCGVVPLFTLGLTAVICHCVLRRCALARPPV